MSDTRASAAVNIRSVPVSPGAQCVRCSAPATRAYLWFISPSLESVRNTCEAHALTRPILVEQEAHLVPSASAPHEPGVAAPEAGPDLPSGPAQSYESDA